MAERDRMLEDLQLPEAKRHHVERLTFNPVEHGLKAEFRLTNHSVLRG